MTAFIDTTTCKDLTFVGNGTPQVSIERGAPPPFDGMSEIWRDATTADADRAAAVREMIMEDEARFVDYAASPLFYGRVEVVVDG